MTTREAVAAAIVASMEEQCDFEHVGLIGAHVSWQKVADAAIQALGLTEEREVVTDHGMKYRRRNRFNNGDIVTRCVSTWVSVREEQ